MLDQLEQRRYDTAYVVYKNMSWWPFFDTVANYGHVINSLCIVKISISLNVSFFMFFNIACISLYYLLATRRLAQKAARMYRLSGLLT